MARSLSFLLLIFLSQTAMAGFYVVDDASKAKTSSTKSTTQAKHTAVANAKTSTKKTAPKPKKVAHKKRYRYAYVAHGNSLKSNIERLVKRIGWGQVVWNLPYDYRWVGKARFRGNSLQSIVRQVLVGYPVQATFYEKNRVIVVKPRPVINYHAPPELINANTKAASHQEAEYGHGRDPKDGPATAASSNQSQSTKVAKLTTTQEAKHA